MIKLEMNEEEAAIVLLALRYKLNYYRKIYQKTKDKPFWYKQALLIIKMHDRIINQFQV